MKVRNKGLQSIPLLVSRAGKLVQILVPGKKTINVKDAEIAPMTMQQIQNVKDLQEVK